MVTIRAAQYLPGLVGATTGGPAVRGDEPADHVLRGQGIFSLMPRPGLPAPSSSLPVHGSGATRGRPS